MDDEDDQDLVGRLFALLTAKGEDVAGLAADGQDRSLPFEQRAMLAEQIHALGEEIALVGITIEKLLVRSGDRTS